MILAQHPFEHRSCFRVSLQLLCLFRTGGMFLKDQRMEKLALSGEMCEESQRPLAGEGSVDRVGWGQGNPLDGRRRQMSCWDILTPSPLVCRFSGSAKH